MARDLRAFLNGARLLGDLETLAKFGALPEGGISRPAFSPAFQSAADWLIQRMEDAGLTVSIDAAGNIIGRMGPPGPAVICGSHIDTVPGGGHLDGALGVLAGLECARALSEAAIPLAHALEVVAFADEEGAYVSLFGSRAMMGELTPTILESANFLTLSVEMAAAGFQTARITDAHRDPSEIAAYVELHIEQGPVIEDAGLKVGVVDSIVGMDLVRYRLIGEARHAGSTPMQVRRDAVRGACEAVSTAFAVMEAEGLAASGRMTFGNIRVLPGASNVVPGEAMVTSEVRAGSADDLQHLRSVVDLAFSEAARRNNLLLHKDSSELDEAAPLTPAIIETIIQVADAIGTPVLRMPSGACHDAQIFARKVPTGMIFVASRGGVSHHPDEFSDTGAIIAGAELFLCSLGKLLSDGTPS